MNLFDAAFHSALHTPVPSNDVILSEVQLGFNGAHPDKATALLQYQDVVMQHMKKRPARRYGPRRLHSGGSAAQPAPNIQS